MLSWRSDTNDVVYMSFIIAMVIEFMLNNGESWIFLLQFLTRMDYYECNY